MFDSYFIDLRSDLLILKTIKQSVEPRNSVCHSATIYANAIMHAGTTVDTFLRENLDWLGKATNWAKFSATAGLGVIHRGHLQQGRSLMAYAVPTLRLFSMVHAWVWAWQLLELLMKISMTT